LWLCLSRGSRADRKVWVALAFRRFALALELLWSLFSVFEGDENPELVPDVFDAPSGGEVGEALAAAFPPAPAAPLLARLESRARFAGLPCCQGFGMEWKARQKYMGKTLQYSHTKHYCCLELIGYALTFFPSTRRFMDEFQWFLMALSVRPGSNLASSAHRLPKVSWACCNDQMNTITSRLVSPG
jgi:hypothetical protein